MNEITQVLSNLKEEKAFIPFLTIGDPNPDQFLKLIKQIQDSADIIELGIPFSDPVADGPTIVEANQRALNNGTRLSSSIALIRKVKDITQKPIVLLTYANIIGVGKEREETLSKFSEVGVNGIIIADVPVEEIEPYYKDFQKYGLANIMLVTPTTNNSRLQQILQYAGGFLYLVSVKGVTGARTQILNETKQVISRIVDEVQSKIPVCVGFGIATPQHVKDICNLGADGAIVGSAIIKKIKNNLHDMDKMEQEIKKFAQSMKQATKINGINKNQ